MTRLPRSSYRWRKLRLSVLDRDRWVCRTNLTHPDPIRVHPRCCSAGCDQCATAGHLIARARGGPDTMANLVAQCMGCNTAQGDAPLSVMGGGVGSGRETPGGAAETPSSHAHRQGSGRRAGLLATGAARPTTTERGGG